MLSRIRSLALASLAVCALALPASTLSAAETAEVNVQSYLNGQIRASIENPFEWELHVVGVRFGMKNPDDTTTFYFTPTDFAVVLPPAGQDGAKWNGTLAVTTEDGTPPGEGVDITQYDVLHVAAGVDIDAVETQTKAAIAADKPKELGFALNAVRERIRPVAQASRFPASRIAHGDPARFDIKRLDTLRTDLENAICANASRRLLSAGNKNDTYRDLMGELRDIGLNANCMSEDARLVASRALIASARPQDAMAIASCGAAEADPRWKEVCTAGKLAVAEMTAKMADGNMSTFVPAMRALSEVKVDQPDHPDVKRLEKILVPRVAAYLTRLANEKNIEEGREIARLLRPVWADWKEVEEAATVLARTIIDAGIAFARKKEFFNARAQFAWGDLVLDGVPAWDAEAEQINRYRALGTLEEGVRIASAPKDPNAPREGLKKLAEAQAMFPGLVKEELDQFHAGIATAWVGVATHHISQDGWAGADFALRQAEAVSPTGLNDEIRGAWLAMAERRIEKGGVFLRGDDIAAIRTTLAKVESFAPERVAAATSKLRFAELAVPVGTPILMLLIGAIAGLLVLRSRAAAKRLVAEND